MNQPIVSFTFDDFPASALGVGGEILKRYGVAGTYYVSLGLMDQEIPAGRAFSRADLLRSHAEGHELGCHTYAHCHAWDTKPSTFERSVVENQQVLAELIPGAVFSSHSYPIAWPRPLTKRLLGRRLGSCRGGGQAVNKAAIDLNLLMSFFLEKCSEDFAPVERILEDSLQANGWLIFSTHDVTERPTRFGCTPSFFERVVQTSVDSGFRILPVTEALRVATGGIIRTARQGGG